jgi:hypothetical protein
MNKLFYSLVILLAIRSLTTQVFAQYPNSWINYNQSYYKIKIAQDGIYRLDASTMQNAGIPISTIEGSKYRMYFRGQEVPIFVSTSGFITSSDYIEFWAYKNDGTLDAQVYNNPLHQANDKLSIFNDTSAYFLTWSNQATSMHYVNTPNNLTNLPPKEPYCWFTSTNIYGGARDQIAIIRGQPEIQGQQIWDSDFSMAEGYIDVTFNYNTITRNVYTPFPYTPGPAARLKTQWCGKFPTQHFMQVKIGGVQFTQRNYFGFNVQRLDTLFPTNNLLTAPQTAVQFSSAQNPTTTTDFNGLSYLQITYPRQFNFDNQSQVFFELSASGVKKYLAIVNFNSLNTTPVLYDITNKLRMQGVVSGDTLKFALPPSAMERQLILVANSTSVVKSVSQIKPVSFKNYNLSQNHGDFIIIKHEYFDNDGNGNNYVEAYRQMKNQHGFQAVIADIHDLYNQFAYGVELHPSAIRNFTDYILQTWTDVPQQKHILLIGKGIEYMNYNITPSLKPLCYIPTWGNAGSDVLLTAAPGNPVPRIPIGRLSVLSHQEIKSYLDKVNEFIQQQTAPQSIANKLWMKRVMHLAGGSNPNDQFLFQFILNNYARQIEDSVFFGGKTQLFSKNSTEPISLAQSSAMDSLFNTGMSLLTFFGHSSYQSLDFNLNNPYNYNNQGKYPLILTNGCLVGNLFAADQGLSALFTFAEERGSIGFLAPSTFAISNSLEIYTESFYKNLTELHYNESIGVLIQKTIERVMTFWGSNVDRTVAEQMLYNGDPSLKLNTHNKPDYALEPQSVYFNPSTITAGVDTFTINVVVTNIGKAIKDSIYIDITRILPGGQQNVITYSKIKAPYYADTVSFSLPNNALTGLGLNQFSIKIDADNQVDELSELNNTLNADLIIQSDDIIPVYPYNFSIVNTATVKLSASTINPLITNGHYVFQIDTTEKFNSPQLQKITITQNGGVISWVPPVTLLDNNVYYWRTSIDTIGGKQYNWHNASFIYLSGSTPGWNQSHYFQYLYDTYNNIELSVNRKFKYVDDVKNISVYNGITTNYGGSLNWDEPSYYINNVRLANWTCGNSVNWLFAVIDSATGIQWESISQGGGLGQYGNLHCYPNNLNAFYYSTTSSASFQSIIDFIDTIPEGNYVLAMSINNPNYAGFSQELLDAFHSIGAQDIDTITTNRPYVLFSKKGDNTYPIYEIVGSGASAIIDTTFKIIGQWNKGNIRSVQIGPAAEWQTLTWNLSDVEPGADVSHLQLYGIKPNGAEELLVNNIISSDTSLSGISATTYPYLKLKLNVEDTINSTSPQLDFWRINHKSVPELAIHPTAFYQLADSLNQFTNFSLDYAIANLSEWPMYNVKCRYVFTDASNNSTTVFQYIDTIPAKDTVIARLNYLITSSAFIGLNKLLVEINPIDSDYQQEQYHFNNYASLVFQVSRDNVNPLLDVTFDGQHILDGDIVSARPEIHIRLKDESNNMPLNDTSLMKINLVYPDGSVKKLKLDGIENEFYPADSTKLNQDNTATAILKPMLNIDGNYQLIVQGYDRSGNASGNYDYKISFEVINKSMISNVLNYPNPFTSQTRFVFTLTGYQVPEFFRIQIMTVTGKVVKEINKSELGPIAIGRNITEYAWDGTDQYGDPLANGLYLYRIITRLNNQVIDHYETSADKYFKNNIGKMYLMR